MIFYTNLIFFLFYYDNMILRRAQTQYLPILFSSGYASAFCSEYLEHTVSTGMYERCLLYTNMIYIMI
jgi:hypothetical protein